MLICAILGDCKCEGLGVKLHIHILYHLYTCIILPAKGSNCTHHLKRSEFRGLYQQDDGRMMQHLLAVCACTSQFQCTGAVWVTQFHVTELNCIKEIKCFFNFNIIDLKLLR